MNNSVSKSERLYSVRIGDFLKSLPSSNLVDTLNAMIYLPCDKSYNRSIDIGKDGKLSFVPKNKDASGDFDEPYRQESTYGKVIRKMLKDRENILQDYTDSEIETLVNQFKGEFDISSLFDIVEGEELRSSYLESNYCNVEKTGSLSSSCMRYPKSQFFLDIYVDNCRMLVLRSPHDPDKIIGRALLWNVDVEGFDTFMDRVYGSDSVQRKFIRYASQEKWLCKTVQSADNKTGFMLPDGSTKDLKFGVNINKSYTFYPYLDTFRFFDSNKKVVHNGSNSFSKHMTLSGYNDGNNSVEFEKQFKICRHTGNQYHVSQLVLTKDRYYVLEKHVSKCAYSGNLFAKKDMHHVIGYDSPVWKGYDTFSTPHGTALKDESIYCNIEHRYFHKSYMVFDETLGFVYNNIDKGRSKKRIETLKTLTNERQDR